jgi:hypothetical protein
MAGVKGMKGGGGARPGAGRKPKPKAAPPRVPGNEDQQPLEFLLGVQNNPEVPIKDRIRAAVAAAQYVHMKKGDGGKKDEQAAAAKKAGSGKFSSSAPPKLVVNNRK